MNYINNDDSHEITEILMLSQKIITFPAKNQWPTAELNSLRNIDSHLHKHIYKGLTSSEWEIFLFEILSSRKRAFFLKLKIIYMYFLLRINTLVEKFNCMDKN